MCWQWSLHSLHKCKTCAFSRLSTLRFLSTGSYEIINLVNSLCKIKHTYCIGTSWWQLASFIFLAENQIFVVKAYRRYISTTWQCHSPKSQISNHSTTTFQLDVEPQMTDQSVSGGPYDIHKNFIWKNVSKSKQIIFWLASQNKLWHSTVLFLGYNCNVPGVLGGVVVHSPDLGAGIVGLVSTQWCCACGCEWLFVSTCALRLTGDQFRGWSTFRPKSGGIGSGAPPSSG